MGIETITTAWEQAATTDQVQLHIHPSAKGGDEGYDASGESAARDLVELGSLYLGDRWPDIRMADFGCGDGRVSKFLAGEVAELWGIDASPSMLELYGERVPGSQTLCSDGTGDALKNLKADLIFSLAVFIHHSTSDGRRMVRGLTDGLKSGGFLALQIPCYDEKREGASWIDVTVWTEQMLADCARSMGLQVVEIHKSPGAFSYEAIGLNHHRLQVFRKN